MRAPMGRKITHQNFVEGGGLDMHALGYLKLILVVLAPKKSFFVIFCCTNDTSRNRSLPCAFFSSEGAFF